jgi:hypothetical protein
MIYDESRSCPLMEQSVVRRVGYDAGEASYDTEKKERQDRLARKQRPKQRLNRRPKWHPPATF